LDDPSCKNLPTTKIDIMSSTTMKISKLRSIGLPRPQPTITTRGPLKSAVCMDGPRQ
jgi:hypothetical protein